MLCRITKKELPEKLLLPFFLPFYWYTGISGGSRGFRGKQGCRRATVVVILRSENFINKKVPQRRGREVDEWLENKKFTELALLPLFLWVAIVFQKITLRLRSARHIRPVQGTARPHTRTQRCVFYFKFGFYLCPLPLCVPALSSALAFSVLFPFFMCLYLTCLFLRDFMTDLGQPPRSVMQNKYLYPLKKKTTWWSEYILSNIFSTLTYYLFLSCIFTIGENDSFQQKFRQKFWIPSTSLNNEAISTNLLKNGRLYGRNSRARCLASVQASSLFCAFLTGRSRNTFCAFTKMFQSIVASHWTVVVSRQETVALQQT